MVMLTGMMCVVIMTMRESRGTSFTEQSMVASTVYTRADKNNKSLCDIVFQKNQYSSVWKFILCCILC